MKRFLAGLTLFSLPALLAFAADGQKVSPKLVNGISPGYPVELTDSGFDGQAEVDITVKADGTVTEPQLAMATHRAFGRAAMAVVTQWKFEPGQRDGAAVDMRVSVPFRFTAPTEQRINAGARRKVFVALPEAAISLKEYGAKMKEKAAPRVMYPRGGANRDDQTVQVKYVVGPDGRPLNPEVVGTPPKEFVMPALQAIAGMAYEPPVKAGKPVYVEMTRKLEFSMDSGFGGGGMGGGRGGMGGGRGGMGGMGGGMGGMGGGGMGGMGGGGMGGPDGD